MKKWDNDLLTDFQLFLNKWYPEINSEDFNSAYSTFWNKWLSSAIDDESKRNEIIKNLTIIDFAFLESHDLVKKLSNRQ